MADDAPEPVAQIRSFNPEDSKLVRFYTAKGSMEGLAAANTKFYTHPLVVALWVGLSCIMIEFMRWWPNSRLGYITYLRPLPAFASMALPIMFGADWYNRKSFDARTQELIRSTDLADIAAYYSRSPSSGVWILEFGTRFVGLIAIDASKDSTKHDVVISESKDRATKPNYSKGTSNIASIRHFYVEEPYRKSGVQEDLLKHALKRCWESSDATKVNLIKAVDTPLIPYVGKALRKEGFKVLGQVGTMGFLGWELRESELKKKDWEVQSDST